MQKGIPGYEIIDHTADIGVRVRGASLAELFENAAAAMFDVMTDSSGVKDVVERKFTCERDSLEELLVEWLGSLLYVFDTERIVFARFSVERIDGRTLRACAAGEKYDGARHGVKSVIKAVTYHGLRVRHNAGGYEATLIFDV